MKASNSFLKRFDIWVRAGPAELVGDGGGIVASGQSGGRGGGGGGGSAILNPKAFWVC